MVVMVTGGSAEWSVSVSSWPSCSLMQVLKSPPSAATHQAPLGTVCTSRVMLEGLRQGRHVEAVSGGERFKASVF